MEPFWIVIIAAVSLGTILSFVLQIVRMGLAHEEKRLALKAGMGEAGRLEQIVAANGAEMAKMRLRIEVLERLATDGDRKLAGEIDRLRNEERV